MSRTTILGTILVLTTLWLSPAHAATRMATLPASAVALTAPVTTLTVAQPSLLVAAPEGHVFRFATRIARPETGMYGITGRSLDGASLLLFVHAGKILSGDLFLQQGRRYRLVENGGRNWWVGDESFPGELTLEQAFSPLLDDAVHGRVTRAKAASLAATATPGPDGKYVVDMLMLYTPLFEARYGGRTGARAETQRLLFVTNAFHENSGSPVRYRALAIEKYTRTQEGASGFRNLSILSRDPAVKAYRDLIGADLVSFLRTLDGLADVSLGMLFNGDDKSDTPGDVDAERDAYSVIMAGARASGERIGDWLVAHELGHNMGGGHNYKAHDYPNLYWKPYAHGYDCGQFTPGHRNVSVMSYGNLSSNSVGVGIGGETTLNTAQVLTDLFETRGDFFSSPYVMRDGMRCGSDNPADPEEKRANNVRIFQQSAPYVAAYRAAKVAPVFAE